MSDRIDQASRLIAAAPERIFEAFADVGSLVRWLPPEGMTGRALEYDFREGGRYRIELTYVAAGDGKTSANTDVTAGRFVTIERPGKIVMTGEFVSDDPAFAGEMVMTWIFAPAAGGTVASVAAAHVPSGIGAEDHAEGLASSLANLARFLGNRR